jgi:hypothetical protein
MQKKYWLAIVLLIVAFAAPESAIWILQMLVIAVSYLTNLALSIVPDFFVQIALVLGAIIIIRSSKEESNEYRNR